MSSLWLNVAGDRGEVGYVKESRRKRLEHELELRLKSDPAFAKRFALELVDNQFPVGLFADPAPSDNVFPGGKSAIDLVGYSSATFTGDESVFSLFELKAGENIPAGALSELLLYTGLVREAAAEKPRMLFCRDSAHMQVTANHARSCDRINSVLLGEELHPLLEHPELVSTLNTAAMNNWNIAGQKPVSFAVERV